jgi:hypothetical protein
LQWRVLNAHSLTVNTRASQVRFGVMVNGRVAQVKAAAVHAVLALDEAHGHLVNARVVAVPLPSERWYRLLDQYASEALAAQSELAGSGAEVSAHADRFARDLFIAAAAFFAAEANDLQDRISLLEGDHRQEEICERLDDIAREVGDAADDLIDQLEDGTWQNFSGNSVSESSPSQPDEIRQPSRLRYRDAMGRIVLPIAAGSLGVVITVLADSLRRNAPLAMVIMVSAGLLICLGLLLGGSWTNQALQVTLRRQAEERRKLNEEWRAIRGRQQEGQCPCCTSPLSEYDSYIAPATVEQLPYDDGWQEYVK